VTCAKIITAPLALDDLLIDAARGHVVALVRGNPGKPLIMAKIEIGLRPVVGHVDFAVLVRRHRARVDVQIRIELANPDLVAARLQQGGERCRHQTLAER
jgi:hypothetical protein